MLHDGGWPVTVISELADLDAVEAAVLEAKNAASSGPPEDAVFLPDGQELDAPLSRALGEALPDGTTFGFNSDEDGRTWIFVITADGIDPALTREVLNTALATLNRL